MDVRRWRSGAVAGTLAAACALAAVATGCGGDGSADAGSRDGGSRPAPRASKPALPPIAQFPDRHLVSLITTLSRARTARACAELDRRFNGPGRHRFPCPLPRRVARSLRFFAVDGGQAYGTGGVVDYHTSLVAGASALLSVTPAKRWVVTDYGLGGGSTIGTSDARTRSGFAEAAAGFLAAVRDRDCDAYRRYSPASAPGAACPASFERTEALARRLEANPGARPRYLGGSSAFGFFALELDRPEPRYYTISVAGEPAGDGRRYVVRDVAPGPLGG